MAMMWSPNCGHLIPLPSSVRRTKSQVTAFGDVMGQLHRFTGPAWDVAIGIGKRAITQRAAAIADGRFGLEIWLVKTHGIAMITPSVRKIDLSTMVNLQVNFVQ